MSTIKIYIFSFLLKVVDRLFKGTASNIIMAISGKYRDIFIYPKGAVNMEPPQERQSPGLHVVKGDEDE